MNSQREFLAYVESFLFITRSFLPKISTISHRIYIHWEMDAQQSSTKQQKWVMEIISQIIIVKLLPSCAVFDGCEGVRVALCLVEWKFELFFLFVRVENPFSFITHRRILLTTSTNLPFFGINKVKWFSKLFFLLSGDCAMKMLQSNVPLQPLKFNTTCVFFYLHS